MKSLLYLCLMIWSLLIFTGCMQKENKLNTQPRVNIHLPTTSANVVFHIRDNKVASYEILNEDGTPVNEGVVYRELDEAGDEKEKCYKCTKGETDMKKCTEIPCPVDHCKIIYCGPLNFQINDMISPSSPEKSTQFTIVADGVKQ